MDVDARSEVKDLSRSADESRLALQRNVSTAKLTTLNIGGPCRALAIVKRTDDLNLAAAWAGRRRLPLLYLGTGSNVLFADSGFEGLVLRNEIRGLERQGNRVKVAGGEDLGGLIRFLNQSGLSGLERMYGIPGTLAGAVVGNAGAYGQEIGERVVEVEIWQDGNLRKLPRDELAFGYRSSRFKIHAEWFLVSCTLDLIPSRRDLQAESDQILKTRLKKYPVALKCPGSYFKNLKVEEISAPALARIPSRVIQYGKVPAGALLEAVGARDRRRGDAWIADYHANLFVNLGQAKARDLKWLAHHYSQRVRNCFGVELSPEVRIVDRRAPANLTPRMAERIAARKGHGGFDAKGSIGSR